MELVYFLIICAALGHPNEGTITKLRIKKTFISMRLFDSSINGTVLTKTFSFPSALFT